MKKIRIALGSNDGEKVFSGHMGEADYFFIYDLFEDGTWKFVEKRENTTPEEKVKHGDPNKLKAAMELFKDADVVMARVKSPNFIKMRDNTKFQPVLTKMDSIAESLTKLGEVFDEIYGLVEKRNRGERPKEIPTIG